MNSKDSLGYIIFFGLLWILCPPVAILIAIKECWRQRG
jgi:hypothetical protein